jgi:hypothetical protein
LKIADIKLQSVGTEALQVPKLVLALVLLAGAKRELGLEGVGGTSLSRFGPAEGQGRTGREPQMDTDEHGWLGRGTKNEERGTKVIHRFHRLRRLWTMDSGLETRSLGFGVLRFACDL